MSLLYELLLWERLAEMGSSSQSTKLAIEPWPTKASDFEVDVEFLSALPPELQSELSSDLDAHIDRDMLHRNSDTQGSGEIDFTALQSVPVGLRRDALQAGLPPDWEVRQWQHNYYHVNKRRGLKTCRRPNVEDFPVMFRKRGLVTATFEPSVPPAFPEEFLALGFNRAGDDIDFEREDDNYESEYPLKVYLLCSPIRPVRHMY